MTIRIGAETAETQSSVLLEHLPPPGTRRWSAKRKAKVVEAVALGLLNLSEACRRYALSVSEFRSWQRLYEKYGATGLRATFIQQYKDQEISRET